MAALQYVDQQFFDSSGNPLAAGKVYTYSAGTTTPLTSYTSNTGGTPNANPIILDSEGRCSLWLSEGTQYKIVVKTSADATVATFDYVVGVSTGISSVSSLNADLNTNGYSIKTTTGNLSIAITPNGTGQTQITGLQLQDSMDGNGYNIELDNLTGLVDDSGNETIILGKTASAVNYVKVTNAATGTAPIIATAGDDANIGLEFQAKGSGTYDFKATTSSAATLNLYEDTDNGTNKISLIAPSSITSNKTVTIQDVTGNLLVSANDLSDVASAVTARTNLGVAIGSNVQAYDATLAALAAYNTNGVICQTAADTFAGRTITAPAAGISIADGNGVAGNPTLSLANDLSAVEGLATSGVAVRTGSDTWTTRTITGTASQITVTNGDGVSGAPTLSIPYNLDLGSSAVGPSEIDFFEDTDNGANKVTLTVPASIASNVSVTLPATMPSASSLVKMSTGGVLSTATPGTRAWWIADTSASATQLEITLPTSPAATDVIELYWDIAPQNDDVLLYLRMDFGAGYLITSEYNYMRLSSDGTTVSTATTTGAAEWDVFKDVRVGNATGESFSGELHLSRFLNYSNTTHYTKGHGTCMLRDLNGLMKSGTIAGYLTAGTWTSLAKIKIYCSSGNITGLLGANIRQAAV